MRRRFIQVQWIFFQTAPNGTLKALILAMLKEKPWKNHDYPSP